MGLPCRGMKAVVFVLDEMDLFAGKARQTLLYNLLDALQAADMQVSCSCMQLPLYWICQCLHAAKLQHHMPQHSARAWEQCESHSTHTADECRRQWWAPAAAWMCWSCWRSA